MTHLIHFAPTELASYVGRIVYKHFVPTGLRMFSGKPRVAHCASPFLGRIFFTATLA